MNTQATAQTLLATHAVLIDTDELVEVGATRAGWIEVFRLDPSDEDGATLKVRAKQLRPATEDELIEAGLLDESDELIEAGLLDESDDATDDESDDATDDATDDESDDATDDATDEEDALRNPFHGRRLAERRKEYVGGKHCGDEIATALAGAELGALIEWAEAHDIPVRGHNNGQIRMNLGNRIRGLYKKWAAEEDTAAAAADLVAVLGRMPRTTKYQVLRTTKTGKTVVAKACDSKAEAEAWAAKQPGTAQLTIQSA